MPRNVFFEERRIVPFKVFGDRLCPCVTAIDSARGKTTEPRHTGFRAATNALYLGVYENFWLATAAWYIAPPFTIVKTAIPL